MRIMVIADEESSWLWDHFEKEKLAGVDLIISCGDLHPHYLSFLTTLLQHLCCMCMEIMMTNMSRYRRRAVPALRIRYSYMKESGSSGLAVRCVTAPGQTSIRSGR